MYRFSTELYYKYYDQEYPFSFPDQIEYLTSDELHLRKPDGKKKSYGIEVQFQKKKFDAFYYSVAYSWFQIKNQYTNGKYYSDEYEMRNSFTGIMGSNLLKNHGFALRLTVMEGMPYSRTTIVKSFDRMISTPDSRYDFYSERFDPIFFLSFRYDFRMFRKRGDFTGYIDIINILNQQPIIEEEFFNDKKITTRMSGILPTLGLTISF